MYPQLHLHRFQPPSPQLIPGRQTPKVQCVLNTVATRTSKLNGSWMDKYHTCLVVFKFYSREIVPGPIMVVYMEKGLCHLQWRCKRHTLPASTQHRAFNSPQDRDGKESQKKVKITVCFSVNNRIFNETNSITTAFMTCFHFCYKARKSSRYYKTEI